MSQTAFRAAVLTLLLAGGAFVSKPAAQSLERRTSTQPAAQPAPVTRSMDADSTRQELIDLLRKHPPSVARVLKLDPSLMRNESYLASYPAVREFLAQHPEIQQNAPYYLQEVRIFGEAANWQPENQRLGLLQNLLAGLAALTVFVVVLATLVWLVRTVLEQRRWNRLSRIQAEVHTKLMDRFSSNDELLTYVQTPSGRRFLESGPSPLQEEPRAIAAPFSRILWSVQVGIVVTVAGIGVMAARGTVADFEVQQFLMVVGLLLLALGLGFVLSAGAAYAISRKLGLFDRPASPASSNA
jgi:hypothetical protein